MFRTKTYVALLVTLAAVLVLGSGCGSSSHSNNLSQAQAQTIANDVEAAVAAALSAAFSAGGDAERTAHPRLPDAVKGIHADQSSGCTTSGSEETCNFPVSYSWSCPDSGTMSISGDITGTLDGSGDGSVTTGQPGLAITPTNCGVASGLTINGNPDVTIATTIDFTAEQIDYPVNLTVGGGVTYGPNPSGSCTFNIQFSVTQSSCTVSGTACGQSLSGSCGD